jgi:hypothetical protein
VETYETYFDADYAGYARGVAQWRYNGVNLPAVLSRITDPLLGDGWEVWTITGSDARTGGTFRVMPDGRRYPCLPTTLLSVEDADKGTERWAA